MCMDKDRAGLLRPGLMGTGAAENNQEINSDNKTVMNYASFANCTASGDLTGLTVAKACVLLCFHRKDFTGGVY